MNEKRGVVDWIPTSFIQKIAKARDDAPIYGVPRVINPSLGHSSSYKPSASLASPLASTSPSVKPKISLRDLVQTASIGASSTSVSIPILRTPPQQPLPPPRVVPSRAPSDSLSETPAKGTITPKRVRGVAAAIAVDSDSDCGDTTPAVDDFEPAPVRVMLRKPLLSEVDRESTRAAMKPVKRVCPAEAPLLRTSVAGSASAPSDTKYVAFVF